MISLLNEQMFNLFQNSDENDDKHHNTKIYIYDFLNKPNVFKKHICVYLNMNSMFIYVTVSENDPECLVIWLMIFKIKNLKRYFKMVS